MQENDEARAEAGSGDPVPAPPTGSPGRAEEGRGGSRSERVFASPTFKFFSVTLLVALLTIPLLLVWALTSERSGRRDTVLSQIDRDWGGEQVVRGPYLVVPVVHDVETRVNGRLETVRQVRDTVVFPDVLDVVGDVKTGIRRVSIFEAPVYNAALTLKGRFPDLRETSVGDDVAEVRWNQARIVVELGNLVGIEAARIEVSPAAPTAPTGMSPPAGTPPRARTLSFEPGPGDTDSDGFVSISARLGGTDTIGKGMDFALDLGLRGRDRLDFAPVGRETTATITSDWRHPSFVGRLLPSSREVGETGFSATWKVPYLARSLPQVLASPAQLTDMRYVMQMAGVRLDEPVDHYALIERALKYGVMFVGAVFGMVFVLEILSKERIHAVQYVLVGLIVVFFFVLLLALAEHVAFALAYAAAAAATSGVIATFVALALAGRTRGLAAGAGLAALFALLYAILRLEDVALLGGAVAGFLALSAVLFATRRVDWSGRRAAAAAP